MKTAINQLRTARFRVFSTLLVSCLLFNTNYSAAAPLLVGGALFPAPGEPDPIGGIVIGNTGVVPFVAPTFSGTLTTKVISGDVTNPFGGLTFTFLLTNDAGGHNAIERLTLNNFAPFLIDASYQTPSLGMLPSAIDRTTADTVGFSFLPVFIPGALGTLNPGSTSALLVLQTSSTTFDSTFASVIDGSTATVTSFAPGSLIPEPSSLALLVIGAVGVHSRNVRLRRRRAQIASVPIRNA